MNDKLLEKVTDELSSVLIGRRFGAVFAISRFEMAIDFGIESGSFLLISVEPGDPRVYLIRRRLKDIAKISTNLSPFHLLLKKHLSGAEVASISKLPGDRVVFFVFHSHAYGGSEAADFCLAIQLTGKSSNVFLLNNQRMVLGSLRESSTEGQRLGDRYETPVRPATSKAPPNVGIPEHVEDSISEFLDKRQLEKEAERRFRSRADAERRKLRQQIARREKLARALATDLADHGDAEKWKRYGDLLLANLANARRNGSKVYVTDFYDPNLSVVEVEVDENTSLTQAAEKFFKRYTKARNASAEITARLGALSKELADLDVESKRLEIMIENRDETLFAAAHEDRQNQIRPKSEKKKRADDFSGARGFLSSDGLEILVGKQAKDNDHLTFRIAKSLDYWFHAADYPGSHVVVRNPNRQEIPQKTLLESAQLAAFYSDARTQPKAAVNYTQKKFVNKQKGAAAGLVRLAQFKTILVEPKIPSGISKKED